MNRPELNKISYLTRWSFPFAIVPMLVAPLLLLSVDQAFGAQYLNSSEPMCNGSDSTVLLCDDFEDGNWWVTNADTSGGRANPANDGWDGNLAPNDAQGYGRCGSLGAAGSNCTSTSGFRTGALAEGWHYFAPSEVQVNELYHRFYTKFLTGYHFGHEKLVFYEGDNGGARQCCILYTPFGSGEFDFQTQAPALDSRQGQNQGNNLTFTPGHWYYVEVHVKLASPPGSNTGILQVWADDCGTNGLGCTGSGTLRLSYTTLPFGNGTLGVIWQENWSNEADPSPAVGEVYNDQVIVRTKRIGPMSVSADTNPPAAPVNLRVQ